MVIIEFETMLEILGDSRPGDAGILGIQHIAVESPETEIHAHHFGRGPPEGFMAEQGDIGRVGSLGASQDMARRVVIARHSVDFAVDVGCHAG